MRTTFNRDNWDGLSMANIGQAAQGWGVTAPKALEWRFCLAGKAWMEGRVRVWQRRRFGSRQKYRPGFGLERRDRLTEQQQEGSMAKTQATQNTAEIGIQSLEGLRGRNGSRLVIHAFAEEGKQRKFAINSKRKPTKEDATRAEFRTTRTSDEQGRECAPITAIKKRALNLLLLPRSDCANSVCGFCRVARL